MDRNRFNVNVLSFPVCNVNPLGTLVLLTDSLSLVCHQIQNHWLWLEDLTLLLGFILAYFYCGFNRIIFKIVIFFIKTSYILLLERALQLQQNHIVEWTNYFIASWNVKEIIDYSDIHGFEEIRFYFGLEWRFVYFLDIFIQSQCNSLLYLNRLHSLVNISKTLFPYRAIYMADFVISLWICIL